MDICELRQQIDEIDKELVDLFIKRMGLSAQVAQYKKEKDLPIYVPAREQEILSALASQAGPEMVAYVAGLYETIFTLSRDYQKEVLK